MAEDIHRVAVAEPEPEHSCGGRSRPDQATLSCLGRDCGDSVAVPAGGDADAPVPAAQNGVFRFAFHFIIDTTDIVDIGP